MTSEHEKRRADTIPELDRKTTGDSVNSRSADIGKDVDRNAERLDRQYAEDEDAGSSDAR